MSKYKVEVTRAAENDLEDLKHLSQKTANKLLELETTSIDKTSSMSEKLKGESSHKFNYLIETIELSLNFIKIIVPTS